MIENIVWCENCVKKFFGYLYDCGLNLTVGT